MSNLDSIRRRPKSEASLELNAEPVSFLRREDDNVFYASGIYSNYPAKSFVVTQGFETLWTNATVGDSCPSKEGSDLVKGGNRL